MPGPLKPNLALENIHRREMDNFERIVKARVMVGVPAALHYCAKHGVSAPGWLVDAALAMLCDLLKREKSTKRGRATGTLARFHQDMIDMARWDEVGVLREKQAQIQETVSYYAKKSAIPPWHSADEAARAEWIGHSLRRIFECVSDVLERTEAFGSPESIKRSYREVERNHRSPTQAFRYCVLDPMFLQMLGIDHDLKYGRAAKIAPWRQQAGQHKKIRKGSAGRGPGGRENVSRETYREG